MARSRKQGRTQLPATVSHPPLIVDGSDREFRALVHDLIAFSNKLDACREAFAAIAGVSVIQYEILMLLSRLAPQGLAVGDVAGRLHRSTAFITIESTKLVRRGLLEKLDDPEDGRRVRLCATRKGDDLVKRLAPVQRQVNDLLFACLDAGRFQLLRDLARDLAACGDRGAAFAQFLCDTVVREAA